MQLDAADHIRLHGLGVSVSDYRNPEPLFCPPPAREYRGLPSAEDLDRQAEEQRAKQETCRHKMVYTVAAGWKCSLCGKLGE